MPDQLRDQLQATLGTGYTLIRELGGGGMSNVFVAREEALARDVVIKLLAPELTEGLSAERFAREIRLVAGLQEPHIVPVLAAGVTTSGLPYYTMPYVRGESLRARIAGAPVMLADAVAILRDIATALEYAHGHGLVHRDIKPENVLLSGRTAVVTDFGIAKALAASRTLAPDGPAVTGAGTLTQLGTSLGTPAYMAPEQAAGDPVDQRADIYAWGVVAYELLAGRHPFAGKSGAQQLIAAHIAETPAPLALPVPPSLAALVARCLAKDPAERPASGGALLANLDAVGSGTGAGAAAGGRRAPVRRRRLLMAGGAAILVALAVGAVVSYSNQVGAAAAAAGPASLAVLPFEHQGDTSDAYLTDGITDEIRGKLAGVSELVVIARASSNAYRDSKESPREIAEALGVRYLLTGIVRVTGVGAARRVIVRPELVELTTRAQPQSRWGQPFDVEGSDVLRLQGDIAGQVVAAMRVAVGVADQAKLVAVPTSDPAAYDAYLRAQAAVSWRADPREATTRRAIPLFEEAVRRDSTLVDAWAGLAWSRGMLYLSEDTRTPGLAAAARTAVERTLALDSGGARGLVARGHYRWLVLHDPAGARADLEAAVRADPKDPQARMYLAGLLSKVASRPSEALTHLERGLVLDPRSAIMRQAQALSLAQLGRFAEARVAADRAIALTPGVFRSADLRLGIDWAAGDTVALRATLARLAPDFTAGDALLTLAGTYGWAMDAHTAARALATGVEAYGGDRGLWALDRAYTYFSRGDTVQARESADTAVKYLAPVAARTDATAAALGNLAAGQMLAGRHTAARVSASRAVARFRVEMGVERGDDYERLMLWHASTAALSGARDSALAWIGETRGRPTRSTSAAIRLDPAFASLRGDPRFEALLTIKPR